MAAVFISEFSQLAVTPNGQAPMGLQPSLRDQTIPIGASSATPTYPFLPATKFVRVHTDSVCSFVFGVTPVATSSSPRMAANQTEYFGVAQNTGQTVAVITNV